MKGFNEIALAETREGWFRVIVVEYGTIGSMPSQGPPNASRGVFSLDMNHDLVQRYGPISIHADDQRHFDDSFHPI
jgi:hypothetical protein